MVLLKKNYDDDGDGHDVDLDGDGVGDIDGEW